MRILGMAIFLSLLIVVSGGVNYYLYRRMIHLLDIDSSNLLWAIRVVFILLAISYPSARIMVRQHINLCSSLWFWIGSWWIGIGFYWFLINLVCHAIIFLSGNSIAEKRGAQFFAAAVVLTILVCAFGFYQARRKASVTKVEVAAKNLPRELDGFKIVQISDAHLGIVIGAEHLREMVLQINSLAPDLIVITGDLIDEDPQELDNVFIELKNLRAKYGVYAVTGNHEFYNKARRIVNRSREAGVIYLQNEKVLVANGIYLYGIDDPTVKHVGAGRQPGFEEVIGPEAKTSPAVLLYHQPSKFEKAAALGIDLMLSGHTHNGQLWPLKYIVRRVFPRIHGLYTIGGSSLYVSQGIGAWGPPMRVGAPPEIVEIRLRTTEKK